MSLRLKLLLLLCILFVAAIGNALFTYQLESYEEEKLFWVDHTYDVLQHSERLLSNLKDTETGQRGFLLTKAPSYLQPYYSGLNNAEIHFQKLKGLTLDNPEQQERLILMHDLMDLKFAELAETIELTQKNGDNTLALEIVMNNLGKDYMDNIRSLLDAFNTAEAILLEQRKGDYKASKAMITTLIIVELVFFVFLAAITFSFLQKNLFIPLDLILASTKKAEQGKRIDVADIVQRDEMGYLLSRFFNMNETIQRRTTALDYKAHHDELTGLKNRSNMFEEIEDSIRQSKELESKSAIFFIDLNDFKVLNDTLGHDAGDAILVETATRLKKSVRSNDSVFRMGGDEFLVLINNCNTVENIQKIANKVLESIQAPVMLQGQQTNISMSIGIAISPDDSAGADELISFSDVAMYAAKRDKSQPYMFFDRRMLKRSSDTKK